MNNDERANPTPARSSLMTRSRRARVGWVIGGLVVLLLIGLLVVPFFLYGLPARPLAFYPYAFFFFPFGILIFFFAAFFVVRLLFWGRWGWGWNGGYHRGYWQYGDATEILRQRYARGEIGKDQFDQMMRDLKAQDA